MAFNISYKFSITDGFSRNIKKFQTGLKKIGPIVTKMSRKVGAGFKSMSSGIDRARNSMLVLSAGIIAFGFTAFNSILDFTKGMNTLKAVTKASTQQMESMRKVARELGRTTAFTAGQAANAMGTLGLAGFKTEQIIGTIPAVLSLAAAGSLPLVEAAGIMTSALKSFQLDIKDTGRITDIFAKAATSAKTDVSLMGQALSQVGSTALTSNIDLETTAGILAVLQDRGIGAAKAGTGLRGAMFKLQKITPDSAKGFRQLGVSIKEVKRLMKDGRILDVFKLLNKAGLAKNIDAAGRIFGLETANVALAFANATGDVEKMIISLKNLNNDAKRMADTRLGGLPGVVLIAKSAFESLQLELGKSGLTKRLTQFFNFVKETSNSLEKINPNIRSFAVDLGIAFVALTTVLIPLGALFTLLGGVAFAFSALPGAAIVAIAVSLFLFAAALDTVKDKWIDFISAVGGRGFFGGLGVIFGTDIENSISKQNQLRVKLEENLSRKEAQKSLASRTPATDINLNGNINVTASGGASVESAEVGVSGAGGNLGLNLAGQS